MSSRRGVVHPRRRRRRSVAGIVVVVVALLGAGAYLLLSRSPDWLFPRAPKPVTTPTPETIPEPAPAPRPSPIIPPPPTLAPGAEAPPEPPLPPLADSDPLVRDLAHDLSPQARWPDWLSSDGLARRFVAAIENVADGESPAPHLAFLAPAAKFSVVERDRRVYVDPKSYERYDAVGDVVSSIDPRAAVALYRKLQPLVDAAYRELGYPDGRFDEPLGRALQLLLATPVVEGDVELTPRVLTYAFADRDLEALRPAQKHLLRMGPRN